MHARRILGAVAIAATLSACTSMTGGPGASPEVMGLLTFAAYPNARVVSQEFSTDTILIATLPGRSGSRTYQTDDTRAQVQAYYQALAQKEDWTYGPTEQFEHPDPWGTLAYLDKHGRFHITVNPIPTGEASDTSPLRFRVDAWVAN